MSVELLVTSATIIPLAMAAYHVGSGAIRSGLNYLRPIANFTENMMAQKNRISRAYQRDSIMEQLITAVFQGSVIIDGPPGSGKTALVEELAYRISENKIPSLKNFEIIRLKLRQTTGSGGIKTAVDDLLNGGLDKRVQTVMETLVKMNKKGRKVSVLFIDEIQDLLNKHITIFDNFKEELARGTIRIIGTTTDANVVTLLKTRPGAGVGMDRRIASISITEMPFDETVKVIVSLIQTMPPYKYPNFSFTYKEDFSKAIVTLAKSRFPKTIFPNAAVSLLEDVHRSFYDQYSTIQNSITLGPKEVAQSVAKSIGTNKEELEEKLKQTIQKNQSQEKFEESLFQRLEKPPTVSDCVQGEASRFKRCQQANPESPFFFLQGVSELFLKEVVTCSIEKEQPVYQCNIASLLRYANNPSNLHALLKKTLLSLFGGIDPKPLLVLVGVKPRWLFVTLPDQPLSSTSTIMSRATDSAEQVFNTLLNSYAPLNTTQSTHPVKPRPSLNPPFFQILISLLEEYKIPTVIFFPSTSSCPVSRESWTLLSTQPLLFDQVIAWLKSKNPSIEDRTIRCLLTSLFYLNENEDSSMIDMAAEATRRCAEGESPENAIYQALGTERPLRDIQQVLKIFDEDLTSIPPEKLLGRKRPFFSLFSSYGTLRKPPFFGLQKKAIRGSSGSLIKWRLFSLFMISGKDIGLSFHSIQKLPLFKCNSHS